MVGRQFVMFSVLYCIRLLALMNSCRIWYYDGAVFNVSLRYISKNVQHAR